jgi:hypothetical protein
LYKLRKKLPTALTSYEAPYKVVSDSASEAARKFSDPQFPSVDILNAGLVRAVVGPGESVTIADTID